MRPWTKDDELRFALPFALRGMRPLLRRRVLQTYPDEHALFLAQLARAN